VVEVAADPTGITVTDNGPGLPEDTLKGAMDFTVRVSNREAWVSPSRGSQGNALKTLLALPWVVDPEHGKMIVTALGKRHEIRCGADPISQKALIRHEAGEAAKSKNPCGGEGDKPCFATGTEVRLEWSAREAEGGAVLWPFKGLLPLAKGARTTPATNFADTFRAMVEGYAVFNPHATIRLDWFGRKTTWEATNPAWEKWRPDQPTSPHWYEQQHLERLIGAYITHDKDAGADRLVPDFLAGFDGLSGSAKRTQVLNGAGLKRVRLSELARGQEFDGPRIARLLAAMREATRPVNAKRLGVLGEEHLRRLLLAMGVLPESFTYKRRLDQDGLPSVLEAAFGWLGPSARGERKIFAGANWSSAIRNPFRSFGRTGEGLETMLAHRRATSREPIVFILHLANPRIRYTDRGKSAIVIGDHPCPSDEEE
jgi:hypothetical protein